MKFLILATCVCMAVAAPQQRYNNVRGVSAVANAQVNNQAAWQRNVVAERAQVNSQTPQVVAVENVVEPSYNAVATAAVKSNVGSYKSTVTNNGQDATAETLEMISDVRPDGFTTKVETSNGISSESDGELKQIGETQAIVVRGSYRYVQPDGNVVEVTYIADENGFQPQSNVIPVAPAIPESIARSLDYIRDHPYTEEVSYGNTKLH